MDTKSRQMTNFRTHFKALGDGEGDGSFEAVVAVFGNVDYQGDRIVPGAFADTLAEWKSSGEPIPVIFTHRWDDLNAHIGEVVEVEELLPGSPKLPKSLQPFGGLYVKGVLDIDEDMNARKIYKMLKRRRIKEWSFAYDIMAERPGEDGANELVKLALIEVGPTLKGANSLTTTVGVKAGESGAKAYVELDGSLEQVQAQVSAAVQTWAATEFGDAFDDEAWAYPEATFPDRVIAGVRDYREGSETHRYFVEFPYVTADDGTVTLGAGRMVEVVGTVKPKSRAKEGRRNSTSDAATLQSMHDGTVSLGATCAAPDPKSAEPPAKSEEPAKVKDEQPDRIDPLAAQLLELELSAL